MSGRCFKRLASVIILAVFLFTQNVFGSEVTGPSISASSAILVDSLRGQVLYKKDSSKKIYSSPASKIMTMLLAVEKNKLDSKVTVSKDSTGTENSPVNLEVGEKYSVEDLIYAAMLTSADDAAYALAEFIGGDVEKFVDMMNEKAKLLDMKNTHFINPTGALNENQYTTAQDLAVLMKAALENPIFNNIFSTSAKPWISDAGSQVLVNQNKLFWWGYDGVDGGKVSYGKDSLQTAITTVTREDQRLICIVLEAKENIVFNDSITLLDYGFANFRKGLLVAKDKVLRNMPFEDTELSLMSIENVYYTHPIGDSFIKSMDFSLKKDLHLPITKDLIVGTARYTLDDDTIIDVSLYSRGELDSPSRTLDVMKSRLLENKDIFYILVFLCLIEAIIIFINIGKYIKKRVYR